MKVLSGFVLLAAVSLGGALQAKLYDFIDLGRPDLDPGHVWSLGDPKVNSAGTIALHASSNVPAMSRAFVFREGAYTEIPHPTGWRITVEDINDYDDVAGGLYLTSWEDAPLVFRDGYVYNAVTANLQFTSTLTGLENASPLSINNSGQILLAFEYDDLAMVYDAGMIFRLGDLDPNFEYGMAWELNNAGQILFSPDLVFPSPYVPEYWESNQYLYTLGAPAAEPLPEGTAWTPAWIHFRRVSDAGVVAGSSEQGLVLYQGGEMRTVEAVGVHVAAINEGGSVVGTYGSWEIPGARRAFLYDGKSLHDLNSLVPKNKLRGWGLVSASDVNDLGQIVGLMRNEDGEVHVFLLNPSRGTKPAPVAAVQSMFRHLMKRLGLLFRDELPHAGRHHGRFAAASR